MKTCKTCGKILGKNNKSGYCAKHLDRSGANNPFFGKHHSKTTIDELKEKCAITTKKLWENVEYRKRVIENATGLKRSEEFKEKQRQHALKQFKDEKQKELRSIRMSKSWQEGVIGTDLKNTAYNRSKGEKYLFELLSEYKELELESNITLHYIDENNTKHYLFPDILIKNKNTIIEYNGSFWHADKRRFKNGNDIVHHDITAKEIWDRDNTRKEILEKLGYNVLYIWSDDFKGDKREFLKDFLTKNNLLN